MHPLSRSAILSSLLASHSALVSAAVTSLPDGLQIDETRSITCDRPTQEGDLIAVHYSGRLENGNQFDSSWPRGEPFTFRLGRHQVIKGWDEGLLDMCVGSERRLVIPPELGYGARKVGSIPANSILVFETKLMHIAGVEDPPPPPPEPVAEDLKPEEQESEDEGADDQLDEEDLDPIVEDNVVDAPVTILGGNSNECRLLGPFALIVQSALGVLALLSLVFKRWRESPRRPLKVWFFDVTKQVLGTALLHVANLAMSMLSSPIDAATQPEKFAEAASKKPGDSVPNPCSFYLLNLAIDVSNS